MTESQILPIALASVPTLLTVLIGILINNSRLSDIDRRLNARIDDLRSHMDALFDDMRATGDRNSGAWRKFSTPA